MPAAPPDLARPRPISLQISPRLLQVLRKFRRLQKSRRTEPAVVMVQRQLRIHLARKRLQEQRAAGGLPPQQQAQQASAEPGRARVTPEGVVLGSSTGASAGQQKESAQAMLGLLDAYHTTPRKDTSCKGRALDLWRKCNDGFEFFCVYSLIYFNWFTAVAFAGVYMAMILTIFKDAPWLQGTNYTPCR